MHLSESPELMVVMGVCGSGKSTIAAALASALNASFLDADDYHPAHNIHKMRSGEALTDDDRWPWLRLFGEAMAKEGQQCVGACSALKRSYREALSKAAAQPVLFVFLSGSKALLTERLSARSDHFMPPALLESQLTTLQAPEADEYAISVDISGTPEQIVTQIRERWQLANSAR